MNDKIYRTDKKHHFIHMWNILQCKNKFTKLALKLKNIYIIKLHLKKEKKTIDILIVPFSSEASNFT